MARSLILPTMSVSVAFIGFGEAASTFANDRAWRGGCVAYDIDPARRPSMISAGVDVASSAHAALQEADVVLSVVTADQALLAAENSCQSLKPGTVWIDMNSVAPATKRAAADQLERQGAHYIDAALLSPVKPAGLSLPVLLSGEQSERANEILSALGFGNVKIAGPAIGRASAIKLCRSIMVKGMEALTAEMVLAASQADVLDEVLASLDASERQQSWAERADYNLDRMLVHGERRSAEMHEASKMLRELGISSMLTDQTTDWQQAFGGLDIGPPPQGLLAKLEAIRATPDFRETI